MTMTDIERLQKIWHAWSQLSDRLAWRCVCDLDNRGWSKSTQGKSIRRARLSARRAKKAFERQCEAGKRYFAALDEARAAGKAVL